MKEEAAPPFFAQAIAVTGGIGSGKSRVASWLAQECGFPLYDADVEVRSLLHPGASGWQRLRAWLGREYFAADGSLLKAKLRQAIFADETMRLAVERDIHPLVLTNLQAKISGAKGPCLVEVPLLYEVRWQKYFGSVLVVYAAESICCKRLVARDGILADQAMAAIRAQMPIAQKVDLAEYTVDNSGAWSDTLLRLAEIKKVWRHRYGEKKLDSHVA